MNLHTQLVAMLAVLLGLAQPGTTLAAGSTSKVYRCGQTYQQTPCPAGQELNVADQRNPAQQAEARKALAADKALAKDLAAERHEREKSVKPQTHAAGVPVSPAGPAASSAKHNDADPCKAKGGKHGKGKVRCVDGEPVYTVPAEHKAK